MALDVVRSLASLVVMAGHLRALFFVSLSHLHAPSTLVTLAYGATSLGHQAVMVFFVLSGYLVGGSVLQKVRAGRWSWRDYLSRRTARLYVVLIPALLLTACWDQVGIRYLWHSGVYHQSPEYAYILPFSVAGRQGLTTLLGNGLFLQTIVVPTFGSNSALWSLANEWWYYLLFPLLVVRTSSPVSRLLRVVAAACVLWFVGFWIAADFAIWLLGAALAVVPKRVMTNTRRRRVLTLAGLALFVAALGAAGLHRLGPAVGDVVVGLAFGIFMYPVVVCEPARRPPSRFAVFWSDLAGFSYTLYLVHLPMLVFLQALARRVVPERWQPSVGTTALAFAIGLVVVAYARVVSRWTELKTAVFRTRIVLPLIRKAFSMAGSAAYRGAV